MTARTPQGGGHGGWITVILNQHGSTPKLRKVIQLGHTYAITIPPDWVRSTYPNGAKYATVTVAEDGTLSITPYPDTRRPSVCPLGTMP